MKTIGRRLGGAILSILGVIILGFLLARVIPGDPARAVAGEQATEADLERVRESLGLNEPLWRQFIDYLTSLLRLDFGTAWHTGRPVIEDLMQRLPATIELAISAAVIALCVGLLLGLMTALKQDTPLDYAGRLLSLLGASIPTFWFGIVLIQLFYVQWGIAPAPSGRLSNGVVDPTHITGLFVLDSLLTGDMIGLGSALSHLILPAICLAAVATAVVGRMSRSTLLEVMGQDHVRTAIGKGIPRQRIVSKHILKPALPPVLTVFGVEVGFLLGGAIITETIFSWPGMGSYVYESIMANDYAPVQAVMILAAVTFIVVNLLVDIVNDLIDPRQRGA